jgi:TonB family protein
MSTQTIDTDLNSSPTRRPGESPRQQSVCIEIPISVHGSRSASGGLNNSQAAKPFLEETRTMIVFPSGAVLRLTESVSEGQILILKNSRVKQEVACRVVSSKTNASAKGYVEVEFFQSAPGFWGITFPSASSSAPAEAAPAAAPEPKQHRVEPSAAKPAFFQPPVAAPKSVAPVAPVVSRVESRPVAPAPVELAPMAATPSVAASIIAERSVPEPFVPERVVAERTVAERAVTERIAPEPIKLAPVAVAPPPPVLTPDSTQELNAAIAAAYASQVEPIRPIKKYEPAQESKPAKEPSAFSATPSSSIVDTLPPPPNKQLNPTKPKFIPPAKPSRETESASEILPMAESIGYQGSEFSGYGKSESPVKQARTSASVTSSSIENRKLDLSSSQIASEVVAGKPMFGSSVDDSQSEKSGSGNKWIIPVAASVILALGAGGFWWFSAHKAGTAKSATVAAAAPATTPSALPAGAILPGSTPTGTASQPLTNPSAQPNSAANQKPGSVGSVPAGAGAAANSLVANSTKPSTPVNARRPNVLPSDKIAAPVSHAANSSIAAAPDVIGKSPSAPGGSLTSILPGMSQPSSAPAPPPSRPSGPPPSASVLQQPKLIKSDSPVYPRIAATRGDWGDVVIDATVGETGQVTDAKVISGPETLRQSALQVVRTQTYQPAKLNGKPVSMHVQVKVPFPKPR